MEDENEVTEDVTYEIVKDANIEHFFSYDLEVDKDGFYYDNKENLMGAVVHFDAFPIHATLVSIFDSLLTKAVMQTQDVESFNCRLKLSCKAISLIRCRRPRS